MANNIVCPKCGSRMSFSRPDGTTRLRVKTIIFGRKISGVCKSCGTEVTLPLVLASVKKS